MGGYIEEGGGLIKKKSFFKGGGLIREGDYNCISTTIVSFFYEMSFILLVLRRIHAQQ